MVSVSKYGICDVPKATSFNNPQLRKTYKIWMEMIRRCTNPKMKGWHRYGGRGIKVCDRWLYFSNFLEDMGLQPEGLSLDRIDNDKDYCPENCRWTDSKQQIHNSTIPHFIEYNGEKRTLTDWGRVLGLCSHTISKRLQYGWSVEKALTTKPRSVRKDNVLITFKGETKCLSEWAKQVGLLEETLRHRLKAGWSVEEVLTTKPKSVHKKNILVTFQGKTKCLTEWAKEFGLLPETLRYRLKIGWSVEKALTTPIKNK